MKRKPQVNKTEKGIKQGIRLLTSADPELVGAVFVMVAEEHGSRVRVESIVSGDSEILTNGIANTMSEEKDLADGVMARLIVKMLGK